MKQSNFSILLISCILLFAGCKKESTNVNDFDFEKAKGIWVPYQYIDANGNITDGPFSGSGFFGAYAESFQINNDYSFIPVIWFSAANYTLMHVEKGTVSYNQQTTELIFNTIFPTDLIFNIVKYTGNELWLTRIGSTYKYQRKT